MEVFYNYYLKKGKKFHLTEIELEEDLQILRGLTKNFVKFQNSTESLQKKDSKDISN